MVVELLSILVAKWQTPFSSGRLESAAVLLCVWSLVP